MSLHPYFKSLAKPFAALALSATLVASPAAFAADDTSHQDKTFVEDSGKGSLAEVQMGKLALANSQNPEVRAFAKKMVHDHTMLIENMKPFAEKMGVPPPTKLARAEQDEYDRLSGKKGPSFDEDYIKTMVLDHHKDLADFTKERDTTANPELKATVAKGREVILQHTTMIDGIAHKNNIEVPVGQ
jgi:putative membrane protein